MWLDENPSRLLAVGLVLALRFGNNDLQVVLPAEQQALAPIVARRASQWTMTIEVGILDGRDLRPVTPIAASAEQGLAPEFEPFIETISAAGADVVIEHGTLTGAVGGLEVCRAVSDAEGVRLEVGVGSQDREAFRMLHGDQTVAESLRRITATVESIRAPGAHPHPLNRLAPERAMRSRLAATPELIGSDQLEAVSPVGAALSVADPAPAHLVGEIGGRRALVACATGTDLGSIAEALDTFHWHRDGHRLEELVLAIPSRNRLRAFNELVELAGVPTTVVTIPDLS